jgi:hypothetical protein
MTKLKDLTGQKFGRLTILRRVENRGKTKSKPCGYICFLCECDCGCGNTRVVSKGNLLHGGTKSCGCLQKELLSERMKGKPSTRRANLIGQKKGMLTVVAFNGINTSEKASWVCKCECGGTTITTTGAWNSDLKMHCENETRQILSKKLKADWANDEHRAVRLKSINESWDNLERRKWVKDHFKGLWKDDTYRTNQKERISKQTKLRIAETGFNGAAGLSGPENHSWRGGITLKGNPVKILRDRISHGMRNSLTYSKKGGSWETLVDYSLDDLKKHLEKRFTPGMSWHNIKDWQIDHKIPVSAFNFKTVKDIDFKRCWALKNLQPLWAKDNQSKGAKLEAPFQPSMAFGGKL